jgi:putative addiction module component (TIGR02574 family)
MDDDVVVSDEWREEILRRCRDLDAAVTQTIPSDEVFENVRRQLGCL